MLHSGRMRGSDTDALGSLLDDLGGMEANAFSRPKTLVGMRDSERSTKTTMSREGSFKARESTTNPTVIHSRQSEVSKQSTGTNVDQFSAYHESVHSLDQLEDMLSNAHVEAEATPEPSTNVNLDDIFWPESENNNITTDTGDTILNWEDAETRKVDPISTREEYHGTESGPKPSVVDEQATKAENKIKPQKSRFHPVEVKRTSHRAFNYLDWEDSNPEYGTDIPDSRVQSDSPGSLDNPGTEVEVEAAEGMEPPPLGHPPVRVNAHGHGAVEGISDIGHRAAAALHLGTRWFMKASRQFAKDVQSTIERTRQGQRQRGRSESGKVAAYYFEWADQLSRLSPGTRAAALGAMQEEDRMEVQRILDEAELGESMLSNEHDFGSERHNVKNCAQDNKRYPKKKGNQQKQHPVSAAAPTSAVAPPPPPPPPPQYEELMTDGYQVDDDKTAHERKHSHYEEHADLLGMENVAQQPQQPPASNSMKTQGTSQETMSIIRDMFESNDKSTENAVAINHTHEQYFTSTSSTKTTEPSDENEPEIRRNLRERRVAETQQRMMRQLAEKRARDDVEDAEKTGKIALRESLRPKINSWTAGKKDNIRALLSTLHIVLWENSGWTSPGIADIVEPAKVRRWYMKANLVIHPDKVKQKHGTLEQVATAEMVFDVLKAAWGKFEATDR